MSEQADTGQGPDPGDDPAFEPNLLVSIHVAKTGGNTFATILERAATGMYCQWYGPDHPKTGLTLEGVQLTPLEETRALPLFDRLLTVPSIGTRRNVLQGHLNGGKMMAKYSGAQFAVWLRDPVDRVLSQYYFWKRLKNDLDQPLLQRFHEEDMTIEQFAAEPRIRDTQTRTTGKHPVEDFSFVGITEEYDRSLDLFGRMYDVDTTNVDQLNFNPKQSQQQVRGRYDVPDETRSFIESCNESDLALYRAGVERFEALDASTPRPSPLRRRLRVARHQVGARLARRSPDG